MEAAVSDGEEWRQVTSH